MLVPLALNRHLWPLAVVFDVWIANPDRHERNLILQPDPPGARAAACSGSNLWLIDSERSGLWIPKKFVSMPTDVEKVTFGADGGMRPEVEQLIRDSMPADYRVEFESLSTAKRKTVLDRIRAVPDNLLDAVVNEVPDTYCSSKARALTIQLLAVRRDSIGSLVSALFPVPKKAP
jgi:hypothetical protein